MPRKRPPLVSLSWLEIRGAESEASNVGGASQDLSSSRDSLLGNFNTRSITFFAYASH